MATIRQYVLGLLAIFAAPTWQASSQYSGDTSGCGNTRFFNGITQPRTIKSAGLHRSYGIHLPSSYDKNRKYPLIVGYHASSSIGLFFEADTKLDEAKYTGDKIVVYPNGLKGAWAGANYSAATVGQDLQFTWDMLADIRKNYCVDSSRVYATGMSIGGGFVGTLACNDTVGGEFAAFAPASGSFYTDVGGPDNGCAPARKLTPMLEFHGGADKDVPYAGGNGEGGIEPPIADWASWWAKRNGCATPPKQEDSFQNDVHHIMYTCQGQEGVIQHYKTDSQKHDWPSTEPNFSQLAAGDLPTHIQASSIIQDFFMKFTRPAQ